MQLGRWLTFAALLGLVACSAKNSSDNGNAAANAVGTTPCSPFDPVTSSVQLDGASIIAAGLSADGTTYVLTESMSDLRLFASTSAPLVEQVEGGSGEGSEDSRQFWLFDFADAAGGPVSVEAQLDGAGLRMGVLKGPKTSKTWDVSTQGETLTLLDASAAAGLAAISTQTYSLDYAGARSDGLAAIVVAPDHAGSYDGFRLFLGPPNALSERAIGSFTRSKSGSSSLTFQSGSATLDYSFVFPTDGSPSAGTLVLDGQTASLSGAAPPVLPDGAQFLCR